MYDYICMNRISFIVLLFVVIPIFSRTTVTIFIHGTVGAGLDLLANPRMIFCKSNSEYSYASRLQRVYRALSFNQEVQLMGKIGCTRLDQERIAGYLSETQPDTSAWYHIVAPYEAVSSYVSQAADEQREYYLFGWSGMLSIAARKKAGKQLYEALLLITKEYRARGEEVDIVIEAHSHGGNVALHAAFFAEAEGMPFVVSELRTYGTPMSSESALGILSPFYRAIYAFSAPRDAIQCGDYFSTPDRKSSSMICDAVPYEIIDPALKRCDIRIVPHIESVSEKKKINHMNLWWIDPGDLFSRSAHPLPFLVFGPAAKALIHNASSSVHAGSFVLTIRDTADGCALSEASCGVQTTVKNSLLRNYTQHLAARWKPHWYISDTMICNLAWIYIRDFSRGILGSS